MFQKVHILFWLGLSFFFCGEPVVGDEGSHQKVESVEIRTTRILKEALENYKNLDKQTRNSVDQIWGKKDLSKKLKQLFDCSLKMNVSFFPLTKKSGKLFEDIGDCFKEGRLEVGIDLKLLPFLMYSNFVLIHEIGHGIGIGDGEDHCEADRLGLFSLMLGSVRYFESLSSPKATGFFRCEYVGKDLFQLYGVLVEKKKRKTFLNYVQGTRVQFEDQILPLKEKRHVEKDEIICQIIPKKELGESRGLFFDKINAYDFLGGASYNLYLLNLNKKRVAFVTCQKFVSDRKEKKSIMDQLIKLEELESVFENL